MSSYDCPACDNNSTFSTDSQFGNLTCDACGYMPRRSVRDEIRNMHAGSEQSGVQ